jgi:hypothetical protein
VGSQISDAVFAVLQVDRKYAGGAEGIIYAGGDVAVFGQGGAEFDFTGLALVSFLPAASVDEKHGGAFLPVLSVLGKIEIEGF